MKALQIDGYCDRASAKLKEVKKPVADATGVVCKVVATSVNPLDWLFRNGVLADLIPVQFPHIIGWDFSGVVDSIGESVTDFQVGDKVYCRPEVTRNGSHAEYILVPEDHLAHMPKTISFSDAASVPIASITAWQALYDLGELREGDRVLIHAGAGSLGIMAIQLAKLKGAHVTATASAEKHSFVKSLGADVVIDYRTTAFEDVLSDLDVVLDTIGGQTQALSWQTLKKGGRLVAVNEPIDVSKAAEYPEVISRFLSIKPNKEILTRMAALLDEGKIRTIVGCVPSSTFTLASIFVVLQQSPQWQRYGMKFQTFQEEMWWKGSLIGLGLVLGVLDLARVVVMSEASVFCQKQRLTTSHCTERGLDKTLVELRKYENRRKAKDGHFLPRKIRRENDKDFQPAPPPRLWKQAVAAPPVPKGPAITAPPPRPSFLPPAPTGLQALQA
ncbi:unnamed protein product [Durusdinium trenchii]